MHISFVRALCPSTMVLFAFEPMLSYVHSHVIFDWNSKKSGAPHSVAPGCSQSWLRNSICEPSRTSVVTACLCAWVDIDQNFAPGVTSHVALTLKFVACAGMLMSALYVPNRSVRVNVCSLGIAYADSSTC